MGAGTAGVRLAAPRLEFASGAGSAPGAALVARANQTLRRCSSSFASAGKSTRADRPALPERDRPRSRRVAPPEGGTRRRDERGTTPPGNPSYRCGCRGDSCCDRHSAHCHGDCSKRRRAQPSRKAWPDIAARHEDGTRKNTACGGWGKSPPRPLRSPRPGYSESRVPEAGDFKQGTTPPGNPRDRDGRRGESSRDRHSAHRHGDGSKRRRAQP